MPSKAAQLEQIKADILERNVCPNLAETAQHLVMGEGNPDADIMFIGEAPGKKEDETGLPFIGAAGRFLDEMLAAANLDRTDVFITSIVKYRPPGNRDPKPDEKAAFWPYLLRQINVIKPKVLITLGRHGMECFLPDAKISAVHGQPQTITVGQAKYLLIPLYHPAAALYNGSMRPVLIDDFIAAAQLANGHVY